MLKPVRFMRIPFFVSGFQVTEDNMEAIARWCQGHVIRDAERPFVRVPVDRATKRNQTEAYVGRWVLKSVYRREISYKVYTEEFLRGSFIELDEELLDPRIFQDPGIDEAPTVPLATPIGPNWPVFSPTPKSQ